MLTTKISQHDIQPPTYREPALMCWGMVGRIFCKKEQAQKWCHPFARTMCNRSYSLESWEQRIFLLILLAIYLSFALTFFSFCQKTLVSCAFHRASLFVISIMSGGRGETYMRRTIIWTLGGSLQRNWLLSEQLADKINTTYHNHCKWWPKVH